MLTGEFFIAIVAQKYLWRAKISINELFWNIFGKFSNFQFVNANFENRLVIRDLFTVRLWVGIHKTS